MMPFNEDDVEAAYLKTGLRPCRSDWYNFKNGECCPISAVIMAHPEGGKDVLCQINPPAIHPYNEITSDTDKAAVILGKLFNTQVTTQEVNDFIRDFDDASEVFEELKPAARTLGARVLNRLVTKGMLPTPEDEYEDEDEDEDYLLDYHQDNDF